MNDNILDWLKDNPEWILKSDFVEGITDYDLSRRAIENSEKAFLTPNAEFFKSLRDAHTFAGIKQIIKIESMFSDQELEALRSNLLDCENIGLIQVKKKAKEIAILKAKDYIEICKERIDQLEINKHEKGGVT